VEGQQGDHLPRHQQSNWERNENRLQS